MLSGWIKALGAGGGRIRVRVYDADGADTLSFTPTSGSYDDQWVIETLTLTDASQRVKVIIDGPRCGRLLPDDVSLRGS